ncbi:MAG: 4a-hydroxytetrahydrobiopterin dehydratase [Acidobacteria bacterium]|nr:4a-hydroxytetrahydrobiopterin dehydratase [Acidobacteriota bacterium]
MATTLSSDAIAAQLAALPGWQLAGSTIVKEFTFAGFPEAVTFTTHSAGGLTMRDFAGAAAVEGLAR